MVTFVAPRFYKVLRISSGIQRDYNRRLAIVLPPLLVPLGCDDDASYVPLQIAMNANESLQPQGLYLRQF